MNTVSNSEAVRVSMAQAVFSSYKENKIDLRSKDEKEGFCRRLD